jgi:hypothetical protein
VKPSVFEWALDAAYDSGDEDGEANKIAPTSGKRAQGFRPGEEPAAPTVNHLLNHIGQWIGWVDDFFTIDGSDNLTLPAGLTLGADSHVTVSGTGAVKHGDRIRTISGLEGRFHPNGGTGAVEYPFGGFSGTIKVTTAFSAEPTITFTCPFDTGERIKSITFGALDSDGATTDAIGEVNIFTVNANGTTTPIGVASDVDLTATLSATTVDIDDTTLSNGRNVVVAFLGLSQNVEIQYVYITYDRP